MDPTKFVTACEKSGKDFGPVCKARNPALPKTFKGQVSRWMNAIRAVGKDTLNTAIAPAQKLIDKYDQKHPNPVKAIPEAVPVPNTVAPKGLPVAKVIPSNGPMAQTRPPAKKVPLGIPVHSTRKPVRKAAMVAVSPSTETQDFPQAHSSLTSQNQQQLRGIAKQLFHQLGIKKGQLHDAIGDTAAWGAENSVAGWIDDPDIDDKRLKYLAAWLGNRYNQKNVLAFTGHSGGSDLLHDITVGDSNLEGLRNGLTKAGLEYRTMIPSKQGPTRILIYDQAGKLAKNVQNFVETNRASLHTAPGTGEFVGDPAWSSRPKAREQYRQIISGYEAEQGGGNSPRPPSRPATNSPQGGIIERGQFYKGGERLPNPY